MKRNYCTGWFENFKSDAYSDIGAVPGSNIQVNDLDIKITRNG
jgi:hypothetical protein